MDGMDGTNIMLYSILECTHFLKLVVKSGGIAFENGVTGGFDRVGVQGGIVTSDALALGATRRGGRKALAVQLQTTVNINMYRRRRKEKAWVS
jgi:hypothetical protein